MSEKISSWSAPTNDEQPKIPFRIGLAIAVGVMFWIGGSLGLFGVLVPAKIAEIAPEQKASIVALMATICMVVSTFANIIEGALSDRTRTRFGKRTPWLIIGSVGSSIVILFWGKVTTATGIIVCASLYQVFLNAIVAPLIAVLADKVAPKHRGAISSMYAIGNSTGIYGGQIVASFFITSTYSGFIIMSILSLLSGPVAAMLIKEGSSKNMPLIPLTKATFFQQFSFPIKNARDYYLALFGRMFFITSKYVIAGYQLYILTDYIKVPLNEAGKYISYLSMTLLISSVSFAAIAGPLADKLNMRKWPVVFAASLIGIACLLPYFSPDVRLLLAYGVIAGIGMGIFSSVDQALNIEVLPDPRNAAKDLGVLNIANNGGNILGPVLAALIINNFGYGSIFIIASATAFLGAILISLIKKVR